MKDQDIRAELIEVCRCLSQRTFVAAADGSVSAKVAPDQILMTPRGRSLGRVNPDQLVQCHLGEEKLSGEAEASPALRLHLAAYLQRTEIMAAIQAQPPAATAFAVAGIPLVQPVLPETVLTLGSVTMILPFLWMLSTSLKTPPEALRFPPTWIPQVFDFSNYVDAWRAVPFPLYFLNTIFVAFTVMIVVLITSSLAAYAFARMSFPGRETIFLLFLSMMMVPMPVYLVPSYVIEPRTSQLI